ncbi:MAG: CCDC90 family protein [Candidatus Contendobacter sp.]|nr:CCDC90 family protein [Candidatus Contendobacter sp.]
MSAIILDTLEYAAKLKAGGFTDQQAETQARALAGVVEKQLITRHDIDEHETNLRRDIEMLRVELKRDIETLRTDSKRDIEVLRAEVKKDIANAKAELIRWVVAVGFLQSALIVGILAKIAQLI